MPHAFLVAGLGYGDEGKGQTVHDLALTHDAKLVVRYNGGPQAGHNVIYNGRHHTFSQFGSASLLPNVETHLSRFMVFNPTALMSEVRHLSVQTNRSEGELLANLTVDERAPVVTPFHRWVNQLRETARGRGRHGSCGMGIGECVSDAITYGDKILRAGDLSKDEGTLRNKLLFTYQVQQEKLKSEFLLGSMGVDEIAEKYKELGTRIRFTSPSFLANYFEMRPDNTVIFEGAQGVLLDETYGFAPFHTWSDCTLAKADLLLKEARFRGCIHRIGLLRAYATRHGAGPFVTEDAYLTEYIIDPFNVEGSWQGKFRVGNFDLVAANYALECVGMIDEVRVNCWKHLPGNMSICTNYHYLNEPWPNSQGPIPFIKDPTLQRQEELAKKMFLAKPGYGQSFRLDPWKVVSGYGFQQRMGEWLTRELGVPTKLT